MAYTTTQLITNAYYTSGIIARNLQSIQGSQTADGLTLLNEVIAIKSAGMRLIPYYQEYELAAVAGQEMYFIPNLLGVETFTFNIGPIRYSTRPASRKEYFGLPRVDNIQSLPYQWHYERCFGGSNFYMYFLPNVDYPCKIWGKFALSQVTLDQDLSLTLDMFYITYLRYALAEQICTEKNITLPEPSMAKLREYEKKIMDISPQDLTIRKLSTLDATNSLNYALINFPGWCP